MLPEPRGTDHVPVLESGFERIWVAMPKRRGRHEIRGALAKKNLLGRFNSLAILADGNLAESEE